MQTAAKTSRLLMGRSSKAGSADSEIVVSHGGLIQAIVVSHLAQSVYSQKTLLKLTNDLIHFAEQAYMLRDIDALLQVSAVLMNLPTAGARQIGLYYHALAINRRGQRDLAEALLETVADNAPVTYRARAIQTLGANLHDKGQLDEALTFQLEALRLASDRKAQGLHTTLMAHLEIATINGLNEDHERALTILEKVSPLVHIVAKQKPFYFYLYHNELAIELGELGRITEAETALEVALASPYAAAYPNWVETRQELEAKRTSATPSVVAVNRAPEVKREPEVTPSPQVEPHRQQNPSTPLAVSWPASNIDSFQRSRIPIPATPTIALNATTILNRLTICVGPRAPPALF